MAQRNVVEAINNALANEMESDPRVMLLGLDVGKLGGVFRTTSGLVERFGADRVVDTPLAEASIIGASLGLALAGMVPVAEIQFLGFTAQGFHQLGPQLGKYRQRSRGRYHCQVTVRAPFGGGIRSPEFHSDAVEAQFVQSPGIKIVMPANPYDAKGLLIEAIRDPDPVLYCEPDRLYRAGRAEVPDGPYTVPFGKAAVVREGKDVTLVAWSAAVELTEDNRVANTALSLFAHKQVNLDRILEAERILDVAIGVNARPPERWLESGGVNRKSQGPEEGVLGGLHEPKECREVHDPGHVGISKLDEAGDAE